MAAWLADESVANWVVLWASTTAAWMVELLVVWLDVARAEKRGV
jgi:hypothetical protein